jgi:hypothetical protein
MRVRSAVAVFVASGVALASPGAPAVPPPSGVAGAPYNTVPAGSDTVAVTLDLGAASAILDLLSAPKYDAEAARALETVPAVEAAIRDSKRPAEVFEHDLEAAFDEKSHVTMFDFRQIREDRGRWKDLLAMIASRQGELTRMASDRARALLPGDRLVSVAVTIDLTFGLPGRADHIVVPNVANWFVVIDLARALADTQASGASEQIKRLSRLMAAEAFQRAWAEYRVDSPAWRKRDTALGAVEMLVRRVAESGPIAVYNVDENFFPLNVWLKQPMREAIDELNRTADRLAAAGGDLEARMALAAEIQKPEFTSSVAGPAGAFMVDGIVQGLGIDAYRVAIAAGPRAFFEAYEKAAGMKSSGLIPLSKTLREHLAAAAKG